MDNLTSTASLLLTVNSTSNASVYYLSELVASISLAVLLAVLILVTAVGNVFVICVILVERHLQSAANYLILSLALADLLVACLVMPLGAVSAVSQQWILGPELCDMWTSSDVLCCTASILHLVAIALDRFWAVTSIDYIQNRTKNRMLCMIATVWGISLIISLGPLLGWKDSDWLPRVEQLKNCIVSQDVSYQVFATITTFYLPLAIILFLYWRIFQTAQERIRRKRQKPVISIREGLSVPAVSVYSDTASSIPSSGSQVTFNHLSAKSADVSSRRRKSETKRERKAAKTLVIITGVFVVCWMPFFVIALLMPLCPSSVCRFNEAMVSFFLWLGYFNSALNPMLYTVFSPEFRNAFRKLLKLNTQLRVKYQGNTEIRIAVTAP